MNGRWFVMYWLTCVLAVVGEAAEAPRPSAETNGAPTASASRQLWVTPEDFGAVGNDDRDDSDAFDALARALKSDVAVLLPARRYLLSRTWELPYVQGGRVMGLGGLAHDDMKLFHPLHGPGAELVWIGKQGGTMVHVSGTNLVWDSVALYGRGKAGTGLLMLKPKGVAGWAPASRRFVGCR